MKKFIYLLIFTISFNSFSISAFAIENSLDKKIIPKFEERKNFYIDKGEISIYINELYKILNNSELPNTFPEFENQFNDIDIETQSHIPKLIALGIMSSESENKFAPENTISINDFANTIANTIKVSYHNIYIDNQNDTSYNFLLKRGIIDKNLNKNSKLTLKQAISIIDKTIKSAPEFNIIDKNINEKNINEKNTNEKNTNEKNANEKNTNEKNANEKNTNEKNTNEKNTVYLTFDDSVSHNTEDILDILKNYNIKATFYLTGEANPEILKRMINEGHAIGNHTYSHNYEYIYSSVDNFFKDFYKEEAYLESIIGYKTKLVRLPGGSNNSVSKNYGNENIMKEITDELKKRGYIYTDWNSEAKDATTKNITSEQIKNNIFKTVSKDKDAIVLMHQTKGKETTVEALPSIIEKFQDMGFKFDIISENSYNIQFKK